MPRSWMHSIIDRMPDPRWPSLPYAAWKDTYATLHMWTQVIGKIALAKAAPLNHSWGIALQLGPRGLITRPMYHDSCRFTIEFDFVDHQLVVRVADGRVRTLPLEPMTVADFHRRVMALLSELELPARIWTMPVEIPNPIRFEQDTIHRQYERDPVERLWTILQSCDRTMTGRRCQFVGKCSPAQFFWGSFDLAVTRFSGRPAPPRDGPAFMQEAYTHEVISHGFWPGSGPIMEPAFYAYAVPEPDGLKSARVGPAAAYYHRELNEFILPYDAVRQADSPDRAIAEFIQTTYEQAATLGKWDRPALERTDLPGRPVTA